VAEYFVKMTHGIEGPYGLSQLAALQDDGLLADDAPVSSDQEAWSSLGELIAAAPPGEIQAVKNLFLDCPRCDEGKIESIPGAMKLSAVLMGAFFVILLLLAGYGASQVLDYKLNQRGSATGMKIPGAVLVSVIAFIAAWAWQLFERGFSFTRKWNAWLKGECPWCEEGFLRRDEVGLFQTVLYFVDAFLFREILIPIARTLSFQWLWREPPPEDEEDRPGKLAQIGRFFSFSLVIFGAVPFLWVFSAENSAIGLALSALVVGVMYRLIFAKNADQTDYRKGVVFLLLPLYFISMVELIRWCLLVSLAPGAVPPDVSDLYLMGLDTALQSGIFLGIPKTIGFKLSTIKLAASWKSLTLTGFTVFLTKLILDASLIAALLKSFMVAYYRAGVYRRTGLRGAKEGSKAKALASVEELTLLRSPKQIEKLEKGLKDVASVLVSSREYARSVAASAEPDSKLGASAQRSLTLLDSQDLGGFAEAEGGLQVEEEADLSITERLLSGGLVLVWLVLFGLFFSHAIETATQREIDELITRAAKPELAGDPFMRRKLYERVLRKAPKHHLGLRKAAATDMDIAARRIDLLDVEGALIDIDRGFKRMIFLQKLTGLEKNPYRDEQQALSARAYALRGRGFFFRGDRSRAVTELRKERTRQTRRLLFNLALDRAAEELTGPTAARQLQMARNELGIDEEYAPARLLVFARALLDLRQGKLESGTKALGVFLLEADEFSPELQLSAKYLRLRALLQLGRLSDAEKLSAALLKGAPNFGPALLELGHRLRRQGRPKAARAAFDRASRNADPAVRDHGIFAGALMALAADQPQEALLRLVGVAKERETDAQFRADLKSFIAGDLEPDAFLARAARWGGNRHKAQTAIAALSIGLRSLASGDLGRAATELRRALAHVPAESAEGELASALLDEIQVKREGRSYQAERFYHAHRMAQLSALLRREIRGILFVPTRIAATLSQALDGRDPKERSKAVIAVSLGNLVPPDLLLPLLLRGLSDSAADVRLASLEALGRLDSAAQDAEEKVAAALHDKDERVRRAAVRVMERFSGPAAVRALRAALADRDRYVRRDAAYALAKLGSIARPALAELVARLEDEQVVVRDAAFAGVMALGKPGVDALAAAIGKSKDSYVSIQTIQLLERSWPKLFKQERLKITGFMLEVLQRDPDPSSRRWAAQKLAQLGYDHRVAVAPVLDKIRSELRKALAEVKDPAVGIGLASSILRASRSYGLEAGQAIEHYIAELKSRPALREDLLGSLLAPGIDEAAVPVLEELIKLKELAPEAPRLLRTLLERSARKKDIGKEAVERLKKSLGDENEAIAERAGETLKVIPEVLGEELSSSLMVGMFRDKNEAIRDAAGDLVSFADELSDAIKATLRAGILAKDEGIRGTHFKLLRDVAFEGPGLAPALVAAIKDEEADPELRAGALWAASRLEALRGKLLEPATAIAGNEDEELATAAMVLMLSVEGPVKTGARLAKSAQARARLVAASLEWMETPSGEEAGEAVAAFVLAALKDAAPEVQSAALEALPEIELEEESRKLLLPRLAGLLKSSDEDVATAARGALVSFDPRRFPEAEVTALIQGEDLGLSERVIASLATWSKEPKGAGPASRLLVSALGSNEESVREAALEALKELGPKAHPALRAVLLKGDAESRSQALLALQQQGRAAKSLVGPVLSLLESNRPLLARAAVKTLGRIAPGDLAPRLRVLAATSAPSLKAECWVALGRLGEPESGFELLRLLDRGPPDSVYLASCLLEIDQARGISFLGEALRTRYGRVPATTAARLLGRLGKSAAAVLPDLDALRTDPNPKIRAAATSAALQIRKTS